MTTRIGEDIELQRSSTPYKPLTGPKQPSSLMAESDTARRLPEKTTLYRMVGFLVLIGAIIGGSSIGVLANFIPVQSSFAKNAWRSGLNAVMFAVPSAVEYVKRRDTVDYRRILNFRQYSFLLLTLLCQVIWTLGLIYASLNTI